MVDLARNGFRIGGRLPIAVPGRTYGLIAVLERIETDVRGDGIPARYECRCVRCGALFDAKGSDVVHRRVRLCCQPRQPRAPRRSRDRQVGMRSPIPFVTKDR